jgi:hypothetical protein
VKEGGRDLISGIIPALCLKGLRRTAEVLRIAGVLAGIRTRRLPNTRQMLPLESHSRQIAINYAGCNQRGKSLFLNNVKYLKWA